MMETLDWAAVKKRLLFQKSEEPVDVGKLLVIWKQVDGHWLLHWDIWNSDGTKIKDRKETQSNE